MARFEILSKDLEGWQADGWQDILKEPGSTQPWPTAKGGGRIGSHVSSAGVCSSYHVLVKTWPSSLGRSLTVMKFKQLESIPWPRGRGTERVSYGEG